MLLIAHWRDLIRKRSDREAPLGSRAERSPRFGTAKRAALFAYLLADERLPGYAGAGEALIMAGVLVGRVTSWTGDAGGVT
jgi:hypothetical protein